MRALSAFITLIVFLWPAHAETSPLRVYFEAASTPTVFDVRGTVRVNAPNTDGHVEVFGLMGSDTRRGYFGFSEIRKDSFTFDYCNGEVYVAFAAFGWLCFEADSNGPSFDYQNLESNFDVAKWRRVTLLSVCEEDLLAGGGDFMTICAPAIKVNTVITQFVVASIPEPATGLLAAAGLLVLLTFTRSSLKRLGLDRRHSQSGRRIKSRPAKNDA